MVAGEGCKMSTCCADDDEGADDEDAVDDAATGEIGLGGGKAFSSKGDELDDGDDCGSALNAPALDDASADCGDMRGSMPFGVTTEAPGTRELGVAGVSGPSGVGCTVEAPPLCSTAIDSGECCFVSDSCAFNVGAPSLPAAAAAASPLVAVTPAFGCCG